MATFCAMCSHVVCDFCKHFDFNGEAVIGQDGKTYANVYVGKGYCRLHSWPADPGHGCDDYHCRLADKEEAKRNA